MRRACGPWGHGVEREVRLAERAERRRPRRSICRACAVTHVLVPEDTLLRRRDGVEVIGAALVAKARGRATARSPPPSGGWPRRCGAGCAGSPSGPAPYGSTSPAGPMRSAPAMTGAGAGGSAFCDAVEAIGVAGAVAVRRFGPRSPWSLASVLTGGRLLCNTSSPFPQPA